MTRQTKSAKAFDRIWAQFGGAQEHPHACDCSWCVVWAALNPPKRKKAPAKKVNRERKPTRTAEVEP